MTSKAPLPVGHYPYTKRVGNLLFLSGVGPRVRDSKDIPDGIEKQCHSVFKNVKTILEEAGCTWDDLVDVTVYLTNMKQDFPIYNKIWAEYFPKSHACRTTVEVNALPTPIAIELKCIAQCR